jgi:nicotinamidase-related amidase
MNKNWSDSFKYSLFHLKKMLDYLINLFTGKKPSQEYAENPDEFGKLSWGAVLVDMQSSFIKGLEPGETDILIPNQKKVIDACREMDLPLVVVNYFNAGKTHRELRKAVPKVPRHKYLTKDGGDGFKNKRLHQYLQEEHVNALLFMGMNASACVHQTAEHAIELGYTIATSIDVIANERDFFESVYSAADWYKEKGIYREEHSELLEIMCYKAIKSQEIGS